MGTSSLVFALVAACIPLMVIAASADIQQQQQIKLEDIERDNLNSAKQQSLQQQQQQQQDAQQQQILAYQQQQQLSAYQQHAQHPLQQQSISLTPSTLQQIAAAYQPQPQQHQQLYLHQYQQNPQLLLQSYLAGAGPQYSQYTGIPSGIYTGAQLAAALQGGSASHASPALTNNIQGSSAGALPVSAYFNQQQIPHQQIIAIPASAFQQSFLAQQAPLTNYLQSAANLQQYVQTPTVSLPAASAVQKPYQAPNVAAAYSPATTQQVAAEGSAYTNQLKQQQLDAYNAQLKQQQQQLYQQAQNEYNALLQQQQQKNAYAAGVKSTAAPPPKPSQSSASSGGFVPIQTPQLAHPNRGVSFSHYRRGRGGI